MPYATCALWDVWIWPFADVVAWATRRRQSLATQSFVQQPVYFDNVDNIQGPLQGQSTGDRRLIVYKLTGIWKFEAGAKSALPYISQSQWQNCDPVMDMNILNYFHNAIELPATMIALIKFAPNSSLKYRHFALKENKCLISHLHIFACVRQC